MADTTLNDLIRVMRSEMKQTEDLIEAQEETTKSVDDLTGVLVRKFFGGDSLEDKIEGGRKTGGTTGAGISKALEKTTGSNSLGDLASLYGALRALASPLGIATLASLAGFDDELKALGIPRLVKNAKATFTAIGNSLKSISDFKLPKLPKITFEDGSFGKIKLPPMPVPRFITSTGEAIGEFIDYKIKLPVINFVDDAGKLIDNLKLKIPEIKIPEIPAVNFLNQAGEKISKIDLKIPELPKIGFLSAVGDYVSKIDLELPKFPKISFGVGEDGVSFAEKFSGAFGKVTNFFEKAFGFLEPLLKPIKLVLNTIMRPFTQILISIIDFVTGFYDGFTSEEEGATFGEKLMAGIEGGLLGVVKGITEAFDLLFVTIPAWLLEKFGMENAAEFLRGFSLTEMVDPVWNGIKNVVTFVGDSFGTMLDLIAAEFNYQVTRITNGFKNSFDVMSNFINNLGDKLYIIISENLRFKMNPIVINNPITGNPLFTIPGFDAGVGDETTRAAAQKRIDTRDAASAERISARQNETAEALATVQAIANELGQNFQQIVINNIDNSTTDNSNNNSSSVVAPTNNADPFALVE